MACTGQTLNPAEAARRLGVSAKALRLYEQAGLITPDRTPAGYRAYGPDVMRRAAEIAGLRALGFSLAQVRGVLDGDAQGLDAALTDHAARLGEEARRLAGLAARVGALRPSADPIAALDLPWPWGGERFEVPPLRRLTWLIGPLGSGKTRLAHALAAHLPGAVFIGLDRQADERAAAHVVKVLARLVDAGATPSVALLALLAGIEADGPPIRVVDLVEQGLDGATQAALAAHLVQHHPASRPLILMTRSSAMLDLEALGGDQSILFCPANHSPPVWVEPHPGAPGYDSVATCLAPPSVRERVGALVAVRG